MMNQTAPTHRNPLRPAEIDVAGGTAATRASFLAIVEQVEAEEASLRRLRAVAFVLIGVGLAMLPFDPTSAVGTLAAVVGSILMSVWIRRTDPDHA